MFKYKENEFVLNGTKLDLSNSVAISEIEQGLGQIRVIETNDEIVIKHHVTAGERLYNEYSKFAVKTAQSTVEMCRIVFEAKKTLEKVEYDRFLQDVGRKSEDSTVRKYLAIGERYDDLIAATNLLPSSWTSIYEITQIPPDVFMAMVAMGESMANLTGAQIKQLKGTDSSDKPSTPDSSPVTQTMPSASVTAPASASVSKDTEQPVETLSSEMTDEYTESDNAANTSVSCAADAISSKSEMSGSSLDKSGKDFADQISSTMLERMSHQSASINVEVAEPAEAEDEIDEPYELVIRFKSRPSVDATHAIVEALTSLFSKHRVDAEIVTTHTQLA